MYYRKSRGGEKHMTLSNLVYGFGGHILPFLPWSIIAFALAMRMSSATDGQRKAGNMLLVFGVLAAAGYLSHHARFFY